MNVVPFQSEHFSIRAIEIQGEPWFVGKDIAEALGYSDTEAMTRRLDEDEKQNRQIVGFGNRGAVLISEAGLYTAILGSSKDEAKIFKKWVTAEVLPSIRKTGSYQTKAAKTLSPSKQITEAAKVFKANYSIMRLIGCDQNGAAISANQATQKTLGVNLLALNERTHLVAENQASAYYTPTELGKPLGLSAIKVNRLLAGAGLQARFADDWHATEAGQAHARRFDTGKATRSGAPVTQLKWAKSVLPLMQAAPVQKAA